MIVNAVCDLNGSVSAQRVADVVDRVVIGHRKLHALAAHLQLNPDVLRVGPTSTLPVLDRFTRALIDADVAGVRVIHPACVDCQRRQRPHVRCDDGWLCSRCHAHRRRTPCSRCGKPRPPNRRDDDGRPVCHQCVKKGVDRSQLDAWTELAVAAVLAVAPDTDATAARDAITKAAPHRAQRKTLADQLTVADWLSTPTPFLLARLLLELHRRGATQLPAPTCTGCGRRTEQPASLRGGRVSCTDCLQPCALCGRRRTPERICVLCRHDRAARRQRGRCRDCERDHRLLDDQSRCRWCRERANQPCATCQTTATPLTIVDEQRVCHTCALRHDLDALLPDNVDGRLTALRPAILAAEPFTTRRWLTNNRTILADLHNGRLPLTHDTLDRLDAGRGIEHLRAMLVAAGLLLDDPERLITRLHAALPQLLAGISRDDQRIVTSWVRWQVLPKLRQPTRRRSDLADAITKARVTIKHAAAFIRTVNADGRTLTGTCQDDVDNWFASPSTMRQFARPFLAWARRRSHIPKDLQLPSGRRSPSTGPLDPQQRWALARRLVTDDTLDPADRVVGALLVLYAQPLARIALLTTNEVQRRDGQVSIRLGREQLQLPEPFATLVQQLPRPRRRGVAEQLPTQWLFPSSHAGRHVSAATLACRMRAIGIDPRPARLAALTQLSAELPPSMLAAILGITADTAARWSTQSGGNWTDYAAARAT
ncbi:MAG TPA: hypothetical protein VFJ14_07010 [Nocardioidaceae bacterium]|nr:hypothetical protein [Nocardioidaceae bacterium]